jgi:hypothetical protein
MSDLKLVAPDQPTPLERLLLGAAANESPSAEQRVRVRLALGLSATIAPPVPVTRAGRVGALGKVAVGSVIAVSAIVALVLSGASHKSTPAPLATVVAAPISAPSPVPLQVAPAAEPVTSPLPPVEAVVDSPASASALKSTPRSVSSVSKSAAPADSAADLSEQLRLIDAARAAVAAGNSSAASQALSAYGSKFPHGSFGQEAAVLRIETVDLQGNHRQATSLARNFLAQHPNSPHVGLVQRVADRAQ